MKTSLKLYLKLIIRRMSNPVFFFLLAAAFVMWYLIKLSYTYDAQITIPVKIEDTRYAVKCNVEGDGYQILLQKLRPNRNTVVVDPASMEMLPSMSAPGVYNINAYSLQNAISKKVSSLKILSVDTNIEYKPEAEETPDV